MNNRLLFVDDEPHVLDGLRRSLRSKRKDWDLQFVTSGEEALKLMGKQHFDILISDVKMPNMNGVELLREVSKRHPETVRIILTGYAEQDLAMEAVKIAHQYLTKPCETDHLIGIITRILNLRKLMKNEALTSLVSGMRTIPSLPQIYKELIEELDRENSSIKRVGEIISKDLGMSAQILHLVNSPFFSTYRTVSSPMQAASLLGLNTVRNLALSIHLFKSYENQSQVFHYGSLWSHSMCVAELAKKITVGSECCKETEDQAFVGGMLHDIGKLILATEFPELYREALEDVEKNHVDLLDAELKRFRVGHQEIAGYMMGIWGLPDEIIEPIAFHHTPMMGYHTGFSPLAAVHMANTIVDIKRGGSITNLESQPDMLFLKTAGLEKKYKEWLEAEGQ